LRQKISYYSKEEKIAGRAVGKQSLDVDAINGAAISSKVILKAGEKALAFEE
jgi:uncharacterized protein with FMN-binding domain